MKTTFRHALPPDHEVWPAHWNDVRFNFKPQHLDRRMFNHDNMQHAYDFVHDYTHTTGFPDEDMDYELPDPLPAMHFKKKRSGPMMMLYGVIGLLALILVPTIGIKVIQKDNPFFWRTKYAQSTTI